MTRIRSLSAFHRELNIWPGTSSTKIYSELLKLAISYSSQSQSPEIFVKDFFEWCEIDFHNYKSEILWPEAIDMCASFLLTDSERISVH